MKYTAPPKISSAIAPVYAGPPVAVRRIALRFGVSIPLASTIASLAGVGNQAREAR